MKATASFAWLHTTDVEFRAWTQAVSNLLQAAGWVKTADTGQANFATITRPTTNTYTAYEIYRFNDSLQSTHPVFMKVKYGTGTTSTTPAVTIQIGVATDGAGNFTAATAALTSGEYPLSSGIVGTASSIPSYASTQPGYAGFLLGASASASINYGGAAVVERSRSSGGVANSDGAFVATHAGNTSSALVVEMLAFYKGNKSQMHNALYPFAMGPWPTSNDGLDVVFFPGVLSLPKPQGQPLSMLAYYSPAFAERVVVPLTVAGSTREYLTTRNNFIANNSNYHYAMWYQD